MNYLIIAALILALVIATFAPIQANSPAVLTPTGEPPVIETRSAPTPRITRRPTATATPTATPEPTATFIKTPLALPPEDEPVTYRALCPIVGVYQ